MTTKELFDEIKALRTEMNEGFQRQQDDHKQLHKEFYIFKGRAMSFMSFMSIIFAFGMDYIKKKIGL